MNYVLGLGEVGREQGAPAGGKGANLGELTRVAGTRVPDGFCVTADAFTRAMDAVPSFGDLLDRLSLLDPDDRDGIRVASGTLRDSIEDHGVPDDVAGAVLAALGGFGGDAAFAVRSSATAEDLPTASFAGQQDSYLNVSGRDQILRCVTRCWASLFTERAVAYRMRNGFDHRQVRMAVVVQKMVFPDAAGVMFTADPVTSDRTVVSVEAVFGLGEALVSGSVNPDVYSVRAGDVVTRAVARKRHALWAAPTGGTRVREVEPERRNIPVLSDAQILRLARLGRDIEAHFGCPQDIEWCLVGDDFRVVQSRPVTTLFPLPAVRDGEKHVYVSVGHQQMMTDAMKPLGISVWQLTSPAPMRDAGGRLFVDVTAALSAPATRAALVEGLGRSDPLIGDALHTVLARADLVGSGTDEQPGGPVPDAPDLLDADPEVVTELIAHAEASLDALQREIRGRSGTALLDFIESDIQELRRLLFDPRSLRVITSAMESARWLGAHLHEWLGERNAADTLAQSVPRNVTSEMGLALLDVADAIRPYPEVVEFLRHVARSGGDDERFRRELGEIPGGRQAEAAIDEYLAEYGMRCAGEVDITRPRWSERPTALVPVIVGNVENFAPGAARRRFEHGRREAEEKTRELLGRLRTLPDGNRKADETERMIDRLRAFSGYREYPKYAMVSRYFVYKRALSAEAERLVHAGVLRHRDDIFYLRFEELRDIVRTHRECDALVRERKDLFRTYTSLTPPRVFTSDGEVIVGEYRREDVPDGALTGMPVSAGVVEGRARVVDDMAKADLEPGDILVTAYTDPSWTPLFVSIGGLVTEVGGLMTHGAVVAREYGVPAVVGVQHATGTIRDGSLIRVNGTDGYVEIMPEAGTGRDAPPGP
ncbi:rifamycin-inactivating phosphotransferase [Rhodococcus sp. NPDC060084]|uniref:rifamycin-inactivating phosphotransferase n=1 Tax=Rhodococcus sp. NPDC060084 TaxID=3347053 RepID=UPI003665B7EF